MAVGVKLHRNYLEDGLHNLLIGLVRVLDVEKIARLLQLLVAGPARRGIPTWPVMHTPAPITPETVASLPVVANHAVRSASIFAPFASAMIFATNSGHCD